MPSTTCGWCSRFANMSRIGQVIDVRDVTGAVYFVLFQCDHCHNGVLGHVFINDSEIQWANSTDELLQSNAAKFHWLPAKGTPRAYDDVPAHIAAAASEAHECESIGAYRAAVQLARSVVEATAKAKGVTAGPLVEKIDKMHAQGLLREHIREAAHEIRHLGNEMAHGDFIEPVTAEEADETLTLMSEVLAEVFQSPARVERRRRARLARQATRPSSA